jgi:hypothetical protein
VDGRDLILIMVITISKHHLFLGCVSRKVKSRQMRHCVGLYSLDKFRASDDR